MRWMGEKIKSLVTEKGLTLVKLAEQIGVTRQTVNDWMNGQVPKGNHLISMCRILKEKPDYFFSPNKEKAITFPVHRARKGAKITLDTQRDALELVKQYEIFFRNTLESEVIPIVRISERNEASAIKIAKELRAKSGVIKSFLPLNYENAFKLMYELGISVIFRDFPKNIKSYAFYTKIHSHRAVFVNNSTNIIDLIFPILHESIHAIRDEESQKGIYDEEEEKFCDTVANYIQLPDEYVKKVCNAISGLGKAAQINKLKTLGKLHSHSLYGIVKRVQSISPGFMLDVGGADTNLKKAFSTVGDILFQMSDPRDYVKLIHDFSPKFIEIMINKLGSITDRKIGELLGLANVLDAKAVKEELAKFKNED